MSSSIYKQLLNIVDAGKRAAMVSTVPNGDLEDNPPVKKIIFTEEDLHNHDNNYDFDENFYQKVQYVLQTGNLQFVKVSDKQIYLIEPYFPEAHLIVFGGGHIAMPLVEFGALVGFSVTVIDDRPSFANSMRFPKAENVICESFDKCFNLINLNESSFVVIVTRGHRHDMDCLRKVLEYNTAYIGMIGSKRRVHGAMNQLLDEGFLKDRLDKVNAPIGIDIGAITPPEIACAIISQVISYKRLININNGSKKSIKSTWPEFDRNVLTELSHDEDDQMAIITIISTKGSVPRKEGAKMLVWSNGKTLGSIGGGCSEGEVIIIARDVIRNGGYQIETVDMTGSVAEDEGMVCGGIMEVLIESFKK
ncbi:MAG TPA: XdhC/CoxI family protein [Clostridium sp.]|uniref:XdhC/CoxI family protein n=1 Tax=Clostridium sp. TaxID=1506 RepID=UPI002F91EDBC